jgi:bifunctional DNA primase/polymerase-like protein
LKGTAPLPGHRDFRAFLNDAFERGVITASERHQRRLVHDLIVGAGPPAGEPAVLRELDELAETVGGVIESGPAPATANPNLEAALEIAKAGHPVFPLYGPHVPAPGPGDLEGDDPQAQLDYAHKKGKAPVGRPGFAPNGKNDASTDPDQILLWWTKRPQSAIGMRTDGLIVLDPDNAKGGATGRARNALRPAAGHADGADARRRPTPDIPASGGCRGRERPQGARRPRKPPRPRRHRRLHRRATVGNEARPVPVRVQEGRSHPADRGRIRLARRAPHPERGQRQRAAPPARPVSDAVSAYGRRALEDEIAKLRAAPDGNRNNQLNKSAFALGQLAAGGEIRPERRRQNCSPPPRQSGSPAARPRRRSAAGSAPGTGIHGRHPPGSTQQPAAAKTPRRRRRTTRRS